jgi:cysteine-rich repeat protein
MLHAHRIAFTAGAAIFVAVAFACSASTEAKPEKLCTAGAYVFCRCKDRSEGAKLCNDDQQTFGPCEPCESLGLGEDPNPGPPPDDFDGSAPPSRCGDGTPQSGEDCDDKNTVDDDGCTRDCKLSPINGGTSAHAKGTACPGIDVHVWGGAHKPTTTGTTVGSGNRDTLACTGQTGNSTTGAAASDRVFRVTAHKAGQMTVTTSDANFDQYLYVVDGPCPGADASTNVPKTACVNGVNGNGSETLTFPVDSEKTYYVFVDGAGISANQGNFRVTFSIP